MNEYLTKPVQGTDPKIIDVKNEPLSDVLDKKNTVSSISKRTFDNVQKIIKRYNLHQELHTNVKKNTQPIDKYNKHANKKSIVEFLHPFKATMGEENSTFFDAEKYSGKSIFGKIPQVLSTPSKKGSKKEIEFEINILKQWANKWAGEEWAGSETINNRNSAKRNTGDEFVGMAGNSIGLTSDYFVAQGVISLFEGFSSSISNDKKSFLFDVVNVYSKTIKRNPWAKKYFELEMPHDPIQHADENAKRAWSIYLASKNNQLGLLLLGEVSMRLNQYLVQNFGLTTAHGHETDEPWLSPWLGFTLEPSQISPD